MCDRWCRDKRNPHDTDSNESPCMVNIPESAAHVSAKFFRHVRQLAATERMPSLEDDDIASGGSVGSLDSPGPRIL